MESVIEDNNFMFAKRKDTNKTGQEIALATNYFAFKSTKPCKEEFHKYSINFIPEVPGDAAKMRRQAWSKLREEVEKHLDKCIFNNTMLYSPIYNQDVPEFKTVLEGQEYTAVIRYANTVPMNDIEAISIFKKFFTRLVRNKKYVPFRRNLFDMKNKSSVENVEVYPGFNTSINLFPQGIYLNLNMMHKVLRPYSVLEELQKLKGDNFKERANELMKGNIVLTRYTNDKTYIIDEVMSEMTPENTFTNKDGSQIKFVDYYKQKYAISILERNQPLLRHHDKRRGNDIYLVPELCYLTGLTDEMRSNFNFMKNLANITKPSPQKKMNESIELIRNILDHERSKKDVEEFGYTIDCQPKCIIGRKLDAGNILMGNDRFSATADDIDRKVQQPMKDQPAINNCLIVVGDRDKQLADTFMQNLQGAMSSFRYQMGKPNVVTVRTIQARDWIETVKNNTNPSTQIVVLILPGGKGKGTNYNEMKRLLTIECPIPSQVVLASTLKRDKGLRSVVNKILIQICAKVGGTPWGIDDLPFSDKPTTIIGIDVYNCKGVSYVGCCATFSHDFTRYLPIVKHTRNPASISELVADCIQECVAGFTEIVRCPPQHMVILRDSLTPGLAKNQCKHEITLIQSKVKDIKITYVSVNKKNTMKIFHTTNNTLLNIPPGTLVDEEITNKDDFEFFLVSQKITQGLAQATQYTVMYDTYGVTSKDINSLIYKMCYLYYNWTGGIKSPAPCQYAKKLAILVGDKLTCGTANNIPHERFMKEIRSLYFL